MSETLARIEKPPMEQFKLGRKLYCLPLLYSGKDAPEDYTEMFDRYWDQVEEHLGRLEKAGRVNRIYHEAVALAGKDGVKAIEQQNERSYKLVKSKLERGATLEVLEDKRLFTEYVDWGVCLSVVRSPDVTDKVLGFYREANRKRDRHIVKRIGQTLKDGEAGLLIMRDEDRVRIQPQLPSDMHVFLVRPPALNDIHRWFRDRSSQAEK